MNLIAVMNLMIILFASIGIKQHVTTFPTIIAHESNHFLNLSWIWSLPFICTLSNSCQMASSRASTQVQQSSHTNPLTHQSIVNLISSMNLFAVMNLVSEGWRTRIECLIFLCHFLQKSPKITGLFAKWDLQLKASYVFSPPSMGKLRLVGSLKL